MTTINVPGKITAIEVDENGDFDIASLAGGAQASPTTIAPSGKPHTIVLTTSSGGAAFFALSGSFNVGDVVEVYAIDASGFLVYDENGTAVTSGGPNPNGTRLRKMRTGSTAPTWGAS